jgi:hypothetical protein
MMERQYFGMCILVVLALAGCDPRYKEDIPERPEGMLDRATFIELHAELQLLEAAHRQRMLRGGDRDAARTAHRKRILTSAGVSDSAFSATYDWWYSQPEALPGLLEEVLLKLDSIERSSASN